MADDGLWNASDPEKAETKVIKKLHSVVWSEGLFLTPQHFQALGRSVEDNIHFRSTASNFANWGLTELSIDAAALTNGTFALNRCSGLLEDGLAFSIPDADDPPLERKIAEHFPANGNTLDVFLAIRNRQIKGRDVWLPGRPLASAAPSETTRYVADADPVPDENRNPDDASEAERKPVTFAKRNFHLLFGTESLDGFSTLRIGRTARNSDHTFSLLPQEVAPSLDLNASPYLKSLIKGRVDALAARAKGISDRRQPGIGSVGFQNAEDLWLLHAINRHLPALKHIWQVRHGHPELPYMVMLQLAGELCTFSSNADANQLPSYDHGNLGDCFKKLDDRIEELLQVFSKSKCVEIPLAKEGLFWFGSIREESYFRNSHFFLAVRAQMGVPDLIEQVPDNRVKIGPKDKIDLLYRSAVPGLTLRHEVSPPTECPTKPGSQYFRLNQSGPLWEEIKRLGEIGIYVHHRIEGPELQLLIALE